MVTMSALQWFRDQRIRRLRDRLELATAELGRIASTPPIAADSGRAAETYGRAMRLALQVDPTRAVALFGSFDRNIPDEQYERAFPPSEENWLLRSITTDDLDGLTAVFEVATRLRSAHLQRDTSARLLQMLARGRDTARLVAFLMRLRHLELIESDALAEVLKDFLRHSSFDRDAALWTSFFDTIPETSLPPIFDVHLFLGRGHDAARWADTMERKSLALRCCLRSPRLADVDAALRLAEELSDRAALSAAQERRGDLLVAAGRDEEAIGSYRLADRPDRVSECHERLGRVSDALETCPSDAPDRLVHLAGVCHREIDALVDRQDFVQAAERAATLVKHVERASQATEAVVSAQGSVGALLAAVLVAGRDHFTQLLAAAESAEHTTIRREWSRFEEAGGESVRAAQVALEAGDRYRAHRLFRAAGRFGDAVRTLEGDHSSDGLTARALASADGGDPGGAAQLYERAGQLEVAARQHELAGDFHAAARCWRRHLGDDAVESADFVRCLYRVRAFRELVDLCAEAIRRKGKQTPAVAHLRELLRHRVHSLDPDVEQAARAAVDSVSSQDRATFERQVPLWVERARAEIDRRFGGVWGLDLGTTTCVAAIYDSHLGRAVSCPWRGRNQFASTLSLDAEYAEVVGLAGEDILDQKLLGHISGAKRRMGSHTTFRIRDRCYRPEEIAGRLIRHAQSIVESFLRARVRERIAELARAELADVPDQWLDWTEQHHDLRLTRSRLVIAVPAYFHNNQKNATRDACEIAGVEVLRLIHEPTAACIAVHRERRLAPDVVVVDLGAGTLDLSQILAEDGVYDVKQVLGNSEYGGRDFDAIIASALVGRLGAQGITVGETGARRRRLDVAAEQLKIALSSQNHAEYVMRGFDNGQDVTLALSRDELEGLLADALQPLRDACTRFRQRSETALDDRPCSLILVGGPLLSPAVHRVVEEALGLSRVGVSDPQTAVACGAALQGAVLDGTLKEMLLLDVTPLALGIKTKTKGDDAASEFTTLIEENTTIPTRRAEMFTTTHDLQSEVDIEVFQGQLSPQSKIGQFRLEGIPPAKAGEPQIEVTFDIDGNCVLTVTARNTQTGASNSITLTDTTLLTPTERQRLASVFAEQQKQREVQAQTHRLLTDADAQLTDADALVREWRGRLDTYRPSAADPDPTTRSVLAEMFTTGNDVESELMAVELALHDLAANLRAHIGRPDHDSGIAATRNLCEQLETNLDRYRQLRDTLARWNAVLVRVAGQTNPLASFVAWHDAGDHARALDALAGHGVPLVDLPHVRRHLDCLAHVGDTTGYENLLRDHAAQLGAVPVDAADPAAFLARTRTAVVQMRVPGGATGAGLILTRRLIVANRRMLVRKTVDGSDALLDAGDLDVLIDGQARAVHRIITSPHSGVLALVQLGEPVEAAVLRVGYTSLIRVGDPVYAVELHPDRPPALISGLVQRFESFSERNLRVLRVDLPVGSQLSDRPLFNAAGEAVAILVARPNTKDDGTSFAVAFDGIDELMVRAGLDRWQDQP